MTIKNIVHDPIRDEFEAWILHLTKNNLSKLNRDKTGKYLDDRVNLSWTAWLRSRLWNEDNHGYPPGGEVI